MSGFCDARFAGGTITVDTAELPATGMQLVVVHIPGGELPLQPDECRRLASLLLEHASIAEREEVDEWP